MSPLSPYKQGSLDSLCGLYALINASRLADPSLTEEDCQSAFEGALRCLNDKYQDGCPKGFPEDFPRLLCYGLKRSPLLSLHKEFFKNEWPQISLVKPFPLNKIAPKIFWSRMKQEAITKGRALIIGTTDPMNHWSVVREIPNEKIVLFDSYRYKTLERSDSDFSLTEKGVSSDIVPRYVFLLKKEK